MNRGHILQSLAVQQMNMAGNPNWWNINNNMKAPNNHQELLQTSPFLPCPSSSLMFPHHLPSSPSLPLSWSDNQDLPESWSQLLLGGIVGEEERSGGNQFQAKKIENWEDGQVMYTSSAADVKQEISEGVYVYCHGNNEEFQATIRPKWSNNIIAVSSPKSSTFSGNNMLDFSNNNADGKAPQPQHSSESKSTATGGGALKKARVQSSSAPATFKVRKEKLGDRISTLHQIVSPFGKTDTASVLLETIGYIRFLQSQIEALSNPYLGNASGNMRQQQLLQSVQGEISCLFPEDSGQLITDNCLKRKVAPAQVTENEPKMDLKSRGLCLVPVSSTLHVGSSNGADYWAPTLGGGFR